ncbi:MAG: M6 family metalloprotease domain-containing protein, partial [Bacteroidales bacterium]|nr:M6 family metalloprotease domain-containing protein [Bacteroidales bacterium]
MKAFTIFIRVFFLLTLFHFGAFAAPADKTQTFSKKQANGKIITYTLNGDEFISWLTSTDGYTLFENQEQEIVYAIKDEDGKLKKSNVLACNSEYRSAQEILFLSTIEKGLFYNSSQLEVFRKNRAERYSSTQPNYIPTTGTPNFLVILVSFSDVSFNALNATKMSNQISQTNYTINGATGSVKDYYFDNSMGVLNANFTVVGPYTLSQNQAYYGGNDASDNDIRPQEMVAEACSLASQNINFANFDNDGDGYVDMIHVVYAGRGEHNGGGANAIWAHSWAIPSAPLFNGVRAYKYSCSNELRTTIDIDGIGTICHEMGHVLGLPDFYDTDYSGTGGQAITLDSWDLMSSGNYNNQAKTPPYLSALERQILGWLNPILLTNNNTPCTLPAISDSNKAYKVNLTTNEFFIFEHRNKKKWDQYTPTKGMLIFHGDNTLINQWINSRINNINTNPTSRGFFIIPAYGDSTNNTSLSTTFPGSQNVTSFTGSKLKNFTPTGKSLINIAYGQDSVLNFNYFNIPLPTITLTTLAATSITSSSATLNGTAIGTGITSKGFEYRIQGASNFIQQSVTSNPLQLTLSNLNQNTIYEYRVYAVSSIGTTYSNIETFTTECGLILIPPFSEGFETPLTCWTNISSNTDYFTLVQGGASPSCSPHTGGN